MSATKGIGDHWTATPDSTRPGEDYPSLAVVRDGRKGLPGPLANLGIGRNGTVYVIAAGLAYHAGVGYWPGIGSNGNANLIGIECEGVGNWTAAQLNVYPRVCAALVKHYRIPIGNVIGHHEWAPGRKTDITTWPGGMAAFRAQVDMLVNYVPEEDDTVGQQTFPFEPTNGRAFRHLTIETKSISQVVGDVWFAVSSGYHPIKNLIVHFPGKKSIVVGNLVPDFRWYIQVPDGADKISWEYECAGPSSANLVTGRR